MENEEKIPADVKMMYSYVKIKEIFKEFTQALQISPDDIQDYEKVWQDKVTPFLDRLNKKQ